MPRWLKFAALSIVLLVFFGVAGYLALEWAVKEPLWVEYQGIRTQSDRTEIIDVEIKNVSRVNVVLEGAFGVIELDDHSLDHIPFRSLGAMTLHPGESYQGEVTLNRSHRSWRRVGGMVHVSWYPASFKWLRPLMEVPYKIRGKEPPYDWCIRVAGSDYFPLEPPPKLAQ